MQGSRQPESRERASLQVEHELSRLQTPRAIPARLIPVPDQPGRSAMFNDLVLETSDLLLDLGQPCFGECWHEPPKNRNEAAKAGRSGAPRSRVRKSRPNDRNRDAARPLGLLFREQPDP